MRTMTTASSKLRTFAKGDVEPEDVTLVLDDDEEPWTHVVIEGISTWKHGYAQMPWDELLRLHGPVTAVA